MKLNHSTAPAMEQLPAQKPRVLERTVAERRGGGTRRQDEPPLEAEYPDHNYCTSPAPGALDLSLNHAGEFQAEISRLQKQIEKITISNKFCLECFDIRSDHQKTHQAIGEFSCLH